MNKTISKIGRPNRDSNWRCACCGRGNVAGNSINPALMVECKRIDYAALAEQPLYKTGDCFEWEGRCWKCGNGVKLVWHPDFEE